MLFCIAVIVNAFCFHSSGYCPLLRPPPKKLTCGFAWGRGSRRRGSPAESNTCLLSSHSKTGGLNCLNESWWMKSYHGQEVPRSRLLTRSCRGNRKAKFSSPKPPRASVKTSGFMKVQWALVREVQRSNRDHHLWAGIWFLARSARVAIF